MKHVLLVKYGEIALRGKNRYLFENRILANLRKNLRDLEVYSVRKEQGRILIECNDEFDTEPVLTRIKNVFGVVGFCPCVKTEDQQLENLQTLALAYMQKYYGESAFTFKVETRRADKKYPLDSREVSALVGGYVFNSMDNAAVDVHKPDVVLFVELRNDAYIYAGVLPGVGGLPAGCSGRGMLLLSGGLDSPVAGFQIAKRGVELECVYFHSPPFTSARAEEKVHDLARRLASYSGSVKLHVIPFTDVQTYLYEHVPEVKLTIFLKRAMLQIASKLAAQHNCSCLITGDSVGQVASQTVESLRAVESATDLPILRPLAGYDKYEIINIAKKIETYEISIRPYQDCCTVFVAKHPETKPKASIIEAMEKKLDELPHKIDDAIARVSVYEY